MSDNEKYQKIDLQAVMDAILPAFRPKDKIAIRQQSNGIYILTDNYNITTDKLIGISLALSGIHNAFEVSSFCYYDGLDGYHICLDGSIYKMLPMYYDGQNLVGRKTFILKHEPNEK